MRTFAAQLWNKDKMEKVIITGGCGFIGSHLAQKLAEWNYDVLVIDNLATGDLGNLRQEGIRLEICDILEDRFTPTVLEFSPDYMIHLAAQANVHKSIQNFLYDEQVNVRGTLKVMDAAIQSKVKKMIFASSSAVYGKPEYFPIDLQHKIRPLSPYGTSKYASELYLTIAKKLYQLDYTILRYGNVYGPRQNSKLEGGVVAVFSTALAQNSRPVIYGDGEQTRDFVFVEDVVSANIQALHHGSGKTLNVSSGTQVSINELYRLMKSISGSDIDPIYAPGREGDIRQSYLCIRETEEALQWKPVTDLKAGLRKTFEYYQSTVQDGKKEDEE
ncbi:NAD-dependent epimerase/dehydratase family protein [Mesobacillus subterraneus]|nr:NAD-dependent epimerase/dehydratase family protein [Mesobacillus subterraneus]